MSIKKKLAMGVSTAALGLSLVGGGTWAAFNDTATINNHFAAGTLNVQVAANSGSTPINFDLSNMKPGDSVQRIFKLNNIGSLAIKEVLLDTTASNFVDGTLTSTQGEFLEQFEIEFMRLDAEGPGFPLLKANKTVLPVGVTPLTLKDLVDGPVAYGPKMLPQYLGTGGKLNLAPLTTTDPTKAGIPVTPADSDAVFIQINFKNDPTKVAGEYVQNKFQGDSVNFAFALEATQWDGVHVDTPNANGSINNGVQGSANGATMPSPITTGPVTITTGVVVD